MEKTLIDGRLLKLLLTANQNEYNSLEDFAKIIGVSTRTIRTYIEQLNDILTTELAQLVYIKGAGYKLEIYSADNFEKFMNASLSEKSNNQFLNDPEERLKYIMKKLINADSPITIDDLAHEINVGRTTLNNDLKKLSSLLSIYDVKVKGKPNGGIELKGSEISIRLYILDMFCEYLIGGCKLESWLSNIDSIKYDNIKMFLRQYFNAINIDASDEIVIEIMSYIILLVSRVKNNKHIEELEEKYKEIFLTNEYKIMNNKKEVLEKELNIRICDNEMAFLTLPLLVRKAPVNNSILNDITINSAVKELVARILDEVSLDTGIHIKYDKELIWALEHHLNFTLNRLMFNVRINNPLLHDIKKHYPLAFKMARVGAKVIENTFDVKVNDDEIAYIALHFGGYIERSNQKYYNINRIALVCGTGLGTARLLHIKLKKILGESKEINTFSDTELTKELLDKYDIVFTTVNLNIETQTPIIKLSAIFNDEKIEKEIEKRYYYKNCAFDQEETRLAIKHISFREDMFFILENETYLDNLKLMTDKLFKIGAVDDGFTERILERENKAPTAFDNYIAFPHAINEKSSDISIAIGILKKPVSWGGNEVSVIILMMIPKEQIDPELLIKTYEEVLSLCQNKGVVESIMKVTSFAEFKKLIKKEIVL